MKLVSDPTDRRLLDDWQRDLPVVPRPFAVLAEALELDESDVITRLRHLQQSGRITRVGGTCAPNTLSASTLAALAAPAEDIEDIAAIVNDVPGINHSYEREHRWNLWFVATGPDRDFVDAALARISDDTGLRVLDLPLVRPFNVDLGFRMSGVRAPVNPPAPRPADLEAIRDGDRAIMQALTSGLPITAQPYADLADRLGMTEFAVLDRVQALAKARILARLGVIVRHRALGWRSNAMVVWDLPHDDITTAGPQLAALPGVTLCYERRPVDGVWPYRLYSMIHARSREDALAVLEQARALPALAAARSEALFSTRCFRQTGAMIADPGAAA